MFIRSVDDGLAAMLRTEIPLRPEDVDIDFSVPESSWSSGLSKTTVDLFLYDVAPSNRPLPTPNRRMDADGQVLRRRTLPVVELTYLVSVWDRDPMVEHAILGELVSRFAGVSVLPAEYLPADSDSPVVLFFGGNDSVRPADLWRTVDGSARGSFLLTVATAAASFGWTAEPPAVTSVVHSFARRGQ